MLSEGDKAIVAEIAREVAKEIKKELLNGMKAEIELHSATCPSKKMWIMALGVAVGSGGGFAGVLKLLGVF